MAQAKVEDRPDLKKSGDYGIRHRSCACQREPGITKPKALCGIGVQPGTSVPASQLRPIEICAICTDLRYSRSICPHCGQPNH